MATFNLDGKSYETKNHVPVWKNMAMVRASQKGDGIALLAAFADFLEAIILPEEFEKFIVVLDEHDATDEKFMQAVAESLNTWISEVSGSPKA